MKKVAVLLTMIVLTTGCMHMGKGHHGCHPCKTEQCKEGQCDMKKKDMGGCDACKDSKPEEKAPEKK